MAKTKEGADTVPVITCAEAGPYLVKGQVSIFSADGAAIEGKKTVALCRCGGSKTKPFCDGTHAEIGFSGAKSPDRVPERREAYAGEDITIYDNRGLCAHAGICTDRLASVWRMGEEPWIDPDGAQADAIVETIKACPSGALSYARDGDTPPEPDRAPEIHIVKGGPYRVVGGIRVEGEACGDGISMEHLTLCRCGGSKNKPFCDGTHWDLEFDT